MSMSIPVYLEVGAKRTFAGAIAWPGWARSGKDETAALQALVDYARRYQRAIRTAGSEFKAPAIVTDLKVVEKLKGSTTTDFGAPAAAPTADGREVDAAGLKLLRSLLESCWSAFDEAVGATRGRTLSTGPRGGGRNLDKIVEHVVQAQEAYLARLGWSFKHPPGADAKGRTSALWRAILDGMGASAAGRIPEKGPRGGARWTLRYFVRRSAWHLLDHAWEIEDRLP